ncbi:MAG: N-acetylmuramoyl-L-alanine amidase [Alphaproteobacteria bacterium]|nr:N-acetylmuramoyl-L-alanine amidase [Alphaproteobacteria bacterium]
MRRIERPSPNHDARKDGVRPSILLMHYTGMRSAEEAISRLTDAAARVSAHYTIDEDGTVYAHVPEARRAWHAGVSHWAGESDINGISIGVEIVNPGHEFGYRAFPDAQIAAVIALSKGIIARHAIPAHRVIGHSDVAPARKVDPGELFPWAHLAGEGVGLWPTLVPPMQAPAGARDHIAAALQRFGYGVPPGVAVPLETVVSAFQRHFRPRHIDGVMDGESWAILQALLQLMGERT